ncbi:penicillin-binding protein activator [Candidatus Woesearchaeota archaeon]|nr:penicillin-binding protein activator [Candidatus Woesearchaeota archaeon]
MNIKQFLVVGLLVLIVLLIGCSQQGEDKKTDALPTTNVKVGVMVPLSGDVASYGEGVKGGIELAKKELSLDNVELIYEDTKCDGKEAATALSKLTSVDKVYAVIGELCSSASLAAAPIAEQQKVVMISPASTAPKYSDAGDYVFRTIPSDALQGDFGAKLVYDKGYRNLAVLYGNEDYGLGFSSVLGEKFPALGGKIVANEAFAPKSTDLRAQLVKIKEAKPDAVYLISNSVDSSVAALKQMKELGLEIFVVASEGLKSDDVLKGAGSAAEGMYLTSVSTGSNDFKTRHQQAYTTEPGPFAPQAYDAMMAIGLALKQGAATSEALQQALYTMEFDGASGHIKFDSKGEVSGNYEVYVVKDGKFVVQE